jgi:formylmethanofuran dehydrogenase subunit C
MRDGTILIGGDVGNEVGLTMRRGLIAVGGSCGDLAGFNMIAGTVFVFGNAGIRPGAAMSRGTLGLFGDERPPLLPSFRRGSVFNPLFLRLALMRLREMDFTVHDELLAGSFEIHHGDFIEGGRGEIILRAG